MSDGSIWAILYGTIIPVLLCSIVFVIRVCTRALLAKTWAWDDSFAYISWVALVALTIITCLSTSYGLGIDMQDIPMSARATLVKLELVSQVAYQLCLSLTKLSVVCFYRRIFTRKLEQVACLSMASIATIAAPSFAVLYLLQCSPATENSPLNTTLFCFHSTAIQIISTVYQILLSLALFAVAVPTLLRIVWTMPQKLLILVLTTVGCFSIATSVIRLCIFMGYITRTDASWNSAQVAIWSVIECAVVMSLANLVCSSRKWEKIILEADRDPHEVEESRAAYYESAWAMDLSNDKYQQHGDFNDVGFRKVCWGRQRSIGVAV